MKKSTKLLLFCLLTVVGIALDIGPFQVPDGIDKILHFTGFFLITQLSISTYKSFFGKKNINFFLLFVLVAGGTMAGLAEFVQKYTPMRECSAADWLTNLFGISLGTLVAYLSYKKECKNIELDESRFKSKDLPDSV